MQAVVVDNRSSIVQKLVDLIDEYEAVTGRKVFIDVQYIKNNVLYAERYNEKIGGSEKREELKIILRNGVVVKAEKLVVYKDCRLIGGGPRIKCVTLDRPRTKISIEVEK